MLRKLKSFWSRKMPSRHDEAEACFRQGSEHAYRQEWAPALEQLREAIRLQPLHAEAHAYVGNVLRKLGEVEPAIAAYDQALCLQPNLAQVHYNRGTLLQQASRLQAAMSSFETALAVDPSMVFACYRLGDVAWMLGDLDAAESYYRKAIEMSPDGSEGHSSLGALLSARNRHAEAIQCLDSAITIDSGNASSFAARGLAQLALGRPGDALASLETAIQLNPNIARVHGSRAIAQAQLGYMPQARASHDKAVALDPRDALIRYHRGVFLIDCREWQAASEDFGAAIAISPDTADAYCNLGLTQQEMGNDDLALATYARALDINPHLAVVYNNRGNLFRARREFGEAMRNYSEALRLKPDFAEAHYNVGQLSLLQGDFGLGWPEYEWREQIEEAKAIGGVRRPTLAWTDASTMSGKRVVLYAEQGLGDTIQFCRYAALVASTGADVTLEVQPALVELLGDLRGVSELVASDSTVPTADFRCSLMSLPGVFNTKLETIPSQDSYVYADPKNVELCRSTVGLRSRPRVGIAWSGNPKQRGDRHRSMTLSQMIAHLPDELDYYCLQNDVRESDLAALHSGPSIKFVEPMLKTLPGTAALIHELDLVISVDTSIAHLGGAMGKPTWILLPFLPDWRWLLDRTDSPWYPSVKLYRQPKAGEWSAVMIEVRRDLLALRGNILHT